MYLRLVHLQVKPDKRIELREFYEERVMPELAETPGCLHAALLEGMDRTHGWISATFWDTFESAEAYEESGLPERLTEESEGLLDQERQWKVELSENMGVEYESAMRALEVQGFRIEEAGGERDPREGPQPYMYVRIVSVKVDPEKVDEFKRRWDEIVVPELMEVKGCLLTFLAGGIRDRHLLLSVSLWENQQKALKYEVSGRFDDLTRKLKDTFSQDLQWKLALKASGSAAEGTSGQDGPQVGGYEVVAGGALK